MKENKKSRLTAQKILRMIENNKEIMKRYKIKKLGLFGSFAKNKQKKTSDIDFLVVFYLPTFDNYMETKFFLQHLFRRKVDLVTENSLKPALEHVKSEALYAKGI